MRLEDLLSQFQMVKQQRPSEINELLDFLQVCYIRDELCIVEYRHLLKELDAQGAIKPDFLMTHTQVEEVM